MYFDVIFLDCTSYKYYDRKTLEQEALGGTEASVVRVAEGLASLGLSVAVVLGPSGKCNLKYFEPTMGQFAFFLHSNDIPDLECRHFVQVRSNQNAHLFPQSKHYIWMHNTAKEEHKSWTLKPADTLIGVSRWHRNQIREVLPNHENLHYIYNPVPEDIYVSTDIELKYEPNLLIWASSPHKGLGKALELFKGMHRQNDKLQFIIFNPGYFGIDTIAVSTIPGVSVYGTMSSHQMWGIIQKALCVFYPTEYPETMGLVAAESNALGTPIATYRNGALKEVVSSDAQMVELGDETGLVSMVMDWSKTGRPKVVGKDEFKFTKIIMDWVKLLAR